MAIVTGFVMAGDRQISGVLIEAFDVPDNFLDCLPIENRQAVGSHPRRRLGSAVTDSKGEFTIEYEPDASTSSRTSREGCVNLWLMASACCKAGEDLEIVYQANDVRECAGDIEHYPICLPQDYVDACNLLDDAVEGPTPDSIKHEFDEEIALEEAQFEVAQEEFARRAEIRAEFKANIEPEITKQLSLVELDETGEPLDPTFVKADESVRAKSETLMGTFVSEQLEASLEDDSKLSLRGRVSLTSSQLAALVAASSSGNNEPIVVDEEQLATVLKSDDGGVNPENDTSIANRVNAIVNYCREQSAGEVCLTPDDGSDSDGNGGNGDGNNNEDNNGGDGDGDDDVVVIESITDLDSSDDSDQTGENVTIDSLKAELPRYIASVLDEQSVLDNRSTTLPKPGTQLDEKQILSAGTFPSLTLPPGPADVPAFYDFYDLQIAFAPVWQEALDQSIVADAEAAYEQFVEAGGDSQHFWSVVINNSNTNRTGTNADNRLRTIVQRDIDITNREWNALNVLQKRLLGRIASRINTQLSLLDRGKLEKNDFTNGVTEKDLKTFNQTREYVLAKVELLREQGQRFVNVARDELERQAAGKSIVPSNETLNQLRQRALSAYPAKYFAANRRQRSVNFGVLITYRQLWTPTSYQVGELVKSIPLAPKEVRKYSKKIVKKQRRSQKEIETNVQNLTSETNATTRAEADIVQKAMEKTNFNANVNGSFTIGVWSGGGSSALTQDSQDQSAETKKSFHEAVVKAAREYKNEIKVEVETESVFESEFQESGELMNPNDELTVTYLFYELQRRYRVEERLHRLTSVVLVAQEMPNPGEIDEDWLIAHRWILNRVLLDDSFKQPLAYVAEGMVAEQFALEEMKKTLAQQRRLVEELKEDVSDSRLLTESRYAALQRSMERTARATQRKKDSGGVLGFVRKLTNPPVVGDLVDRFIGGDAEAPEAARVREAAAQDAYQRELQRLRDLEGRLAQTNANLADVTDEYSDRLSQHLSNVLVVTELKNHVKDNITHYMQAIWMHEPFQQRWLRLKDVPVPVLRRSKRKYIIDSLPEATSLANVAHLGTMVHNYTVLPELDPPQLNPNGNIETVPLYQVADIDDLLGFRANYMIFPMRKPNAITSFMMEPYVEKAAGGMGITDPDDLGNISLDEFSEYICCLKERLSDEEFDGLRGTLKAQLRKLLQSPLRDDEEIVVPMDAMYIEALPGATPILEDFKLLHRQIDAANAQEDLRLLKMEKIRYAQRLIEGRLDDPDSDARYEFTNNPDLDFAVTQPQNGGETP